MNYWDSYDSVLSAAINGEKVLLLKQEISICKYIASFAHKYRNMQYVRCKVTMCLQHADFSLQYSGGKTSSSKISFLPDTSLRLNIFVLSGHVLRWDSFSGVLSMFNLSLPWSSNNHFQNETLSGEGQRCLSRSLCCLIPVKKYMIKVSVRDLGLLGYGETVNKPCCQK